MTSTLKLSHDLTVSGLHFAVGLRTALDAVVQVVVGTGDLETRCTGWLITPQLVVAPEYGLRTSQDLQGEIRVVGYSTDGDAWYDVIDPTVPSERLISNSVIQDLGTEGLAVFRLKHEHPTPRLAYRLDMPAPHEMLITAHYGIGNEVSGPRLSFSELTSTDDDRISYFGEPLPGSGGAILYDMQWRFLGIHIMSSQNMSYGMAYSTVMAILQRSQWWRNIAQYHGFANVAAALEKSHTLDQSSPPHSPVLLSAALRFSIDPASLDAVDRNALMPHVVDVDAPRWSLTLKSRHDLLASAPLSSFLNILPDAPDSLEQKIIGPILRGGPYPLDVAAEEELVHWLEAVRWFAHVVPDLPTPRQIYRLLQYRRIRGRLSHIAGRDFVGRKDELIEMHAWFDSRSKAPLNVWGIGGIGKSALVAHFLQSLPPDTLLLWLDFDRADLAPDNAPSIISALLEQAEIQSTQGTALIPSMSSTTEADKLFNAQREALAELLAAEKNRRIVIVLDSFEAAQYRERYQELWPELEGLAKRVGGIQLIVSGRAPQKKLKFLDASAKQIPLSGLAPEIVRDWLSRHDVPPGPAQERVVHAAGGMPLILKLVEQLVLAGGGLDDLPEKMVAGVLYDRILNRIHSPEFKDVAKGAIVVRRLSQEMVGPLFENLLRLPSRPTSTWFHEFAREASLFEGDEALRLRPEVREAALALLERDSPQLVKDIERRALAWYETCDINDPMIAAERVYHFLRLGDQDMALKAWREGCAKYLEHAEDTLHGEAKSWLLHRLGTSESIFDADVKLWELDASDRLVKARAKGQFDLAQGILRERADRSDTGILAFQEAYELWRHGNVQLALNHLLHYDVITPGIHSRQRAILAALLHVQLGQRREAFELLVNWRSKQLWTDRKDGLVECAAVHAALVCLKAPIALERSFFAKAYLKRGFLPMDFLDQKSLSRVNMPLQMVASIELTSEKSASDFIERLTKYRANALEHYAAPKSNVSMRAWENGTMFDKPNFLDEHPIMAMLVASRWRWTLLGEQVMLTVFEKALRTPVVRSLDQSVITVLGLFTHIPGFRLVRNGALFDLLLDELQSKISLHSSDVALNIRNGRDKLRSTALQWCEGDIKPLRQLVQRFAGHREENVDDLA